MPFPEPAVDPVWVDEDAGPVVRPYAMTSGRTRPAKGTFDMVTIVAATRPAAALAPGWGPEHVATMELSQRPISVAEIAAHLDLPISVVRVFLGDLLHADLITIGPPPSPDRHFDDKTLEAMLDGLRSL